MRVGFMCIQCASYVVHTHSKSRKNENVSVNCIFVSKSGIFYFIFAAIIYNFSHSTLPLPTNHSINSIFSIKFERNKCVMNEEKGVIWILLLETHCDKINQSFIITIECLIIIFISSNARHEWKKKTITIILQENKPCLHPCSHLHYSKKKHTKKLLGKMERRNKNWQTNNIIFLVVAVSFFFNRQE